MKKIFLALLAALMCASGVFASDDAGFIAYRVSGEISFTKEKILDFDGSRAWFGGAVEGFLSTGKKLNPMVSASAGIGYVDKEFKYSWANVGAGISGSMNGEIYYSLIVQSALADFLPQLVGYLSKEFAFESRKFNVSLCGGIYLPVGDEKYGFVTEGGDRYSGWFLEPSVSSVFDIFGKAVEFKAVFNYTATNQMVYGKTFESYQVTLYQKWNAYFSTFGSYKADPWYPGVDGIWNFGVQISGDTKK